MLTNQMYVFFIFIINGLFIGMLFDIFRILRKSFKTPDVITYIEDILFWIITGITILYSIFKFNSGEIRLYIFIGLFIGMLLYILTFSKYFIKINLFILDQIKKILNFILYPFKKKFYFIKRIFISPISFIFINFKKYCNLSKMVKFFQKIRFNIKKEN